MRSSQTVFGVGQGVIAVGEDQKQQGVYQTALSHTLIQTTFQAQGMNQWSCWTYKKLPISCIGTGRAKHVPTSALSYGY